MKMTSLNNNSFFASWNKIFNAERELSPRLSYRAKLVNDYIDNQHKKFIELRKAILDKYALKDEAGNPVLKDNQIQFKEGCLNDVNQEFNELVQLDLEPAPPSKLSLADLEKDGVKLTGIDINVLIDLLDVGEDASGKSPLSIVPTPSK
jgi:hypothetical protein